MSGVNCSVLQGKNKLLVVDDTKMEEKKKGNHFLMPSICFFMRSGPYIVIKTT